ncbi:Negative regulator of mitotic exit [Lunasporangiospora selenospora]|uniref:Negative regulator of mitotic exit n=1 Tax=Lunasporangiospora selenospora TaxID=979761 RepID=A0A9P6FWB4_9FUNG|nr:Negative regulator of mitotic exit [Lunasporangiospora selenospora]
MYFGGKDAKNKCSDSLYVLHTFRNEWNRPQISGLLPPPRHSHAACVIGTTMYIFGGQFNNYYLNDIASFDMKSLNTSNPKWSRLEPASDLPPARAGHIAAAYDGRIYVFGGADEQFFYNDIWCYDPQTNRWEAVPAFGVLPTSRQGHASAVIDDTMYIHGGMNHEDELLGDLSAFKINDRRWLTFPDAVNSASPRTEHAVCAVGDKIYIMGGQLDPEDNEESGSIYILDTTKIRYHEPSSMTSLRSAYDNDSLARLEVSGPEEYTSHYQRPTPSPDSSRHPSNDQSNDPRRNFQQQQQSTSAFNDSHESHHPNSQNDSRMNRFADDSHHGTHPQARLSIDDSDSSPISRRRTVGKPAGYTAPEPIEPRSSQSTEDMYDRARAPSSGSPINAHDPNIGRRQSLPDKKHIPRVSMDQTPRVTSHGHHSISEDSNQVRQDSASPYPGSKDAEIKDLKQREQWLLAEIAMSRKRMGERPLSVEGNVWKEEMGAYDAERDSEKYRIMQTLLHVKSELERTKTSVVTQAQTASNKLREAERVRTAALQEAAYLKAKVSALQSGEVSALVKTETTRALDLEKRLTLALAQVDKLQSQCSQYEIDLERERSARESGMEREKQISLRADEVQTSHTRSLAEQASLHERATVAEASLRELEAKNAATEAGFSSYEQQSKTLLSQISALKVTIEHQKKSLEKTKKAYTYSIERAEDFERRWTQARQENDNKQLEFASVRAELDRHQREAEHWKTKAQEAELLWQESKNQNEAMRVMLENEMNEPSSTNSAGSVSRKHDSIMAITSASRVAELEHELGSLRHLLRESQLAASQANKSLGESMVRLSQLEQSSMTARAEATTAQRQLKDYEDRVADLESELTRKEESLDEKAKEQENNEVQLGLLRGVMRENGLLADDLILEALSQNVDGKAVVPSPSNAVANIKALKDKLENAERRAQEAEDQLIYLVTLKTEQETKIQQLEADYQTTVHYAQGTETTLQQLRDEAQVSKVEKDKMQVSMTELETSRSKIREDHATAQEAAMQATQLLEKDIEDLHQQLHESVGRTMELEQTLEETTRGLQAAEASAEEVRLELKTLKTKHHEHKKQNTVTSENYESKLAELESTLEETQASLAETRSQLETSQYEIEQAHELGKNTGKELEEVLTQVKTLEKAKEQLLTESTEAKEKLAEATKALATATEEKANIAAQAKTEEDTRKAAEEVQRAESRVKVAEEKAHTLEARHHELEIELEKAQQLIDSLQARIRDLEEQLRASENKISILLDNFQGPESVRNSVASLGGNDDLIMRLMEATGHAGRTSSPSGTAPYLAPRSRGSHLTDRTSSDSLTNEIEMLKSEWNQTKLQAANSYPSVVTTSATISSAAGTTGASSIEKADGVETESVKEGAATLSSPTTKDGSEGAVQAASGTGTGGPTSPTATAAAAATGTPSRSAQNLEEYEKMITDMENARRQ